MNLKSVYSKPVIRPKAVTIIFKLSLLTFFTIFLIISWVMQAAAKLKRKCGAGATPLIRHMNGLKEDGNSQRKKMAC